MERKIVSEEELISILNGELSKFGECKDCQFYHVSKLQESDNDGCNWSSEVMLRCSGVPVKICQKFAHRIINEARKKYNLKI